MLSFISKFVLNSLIVIPFLYLFSEATLNEAILAAAALSIVAYFVGDQLILRRTNNLIATIADVGLTYFFLWVVGDSMNWNLTFIELLSVSLAIGAVEYMFHLFIAPELHRTLVKGQRKQ